jgi:hypothetical protein
MTAQAALEPHTARKLAVGLGCFSVALGMSELFATRRVARWLGMEDRESLLRAYGLRELATGVGVLASRNPAPWLWARVAGDGLDLATLRSAAARADGPRQQNVELVTAAVMGVTALDILAARSVSAQSQSERRQATYDYSRRTGFPDTPDRMRGAARDFVVPQDFRTPALMKPWN